MIDVPVQARLRPMYKGLLVPFTVQWFEGVPDFKVTDPEKVVTCVNERRCGMCGTPMGKKVVFIGGPMSLTNRLFTDPPMHERCARYAYSVCPFLCGSVAMMSESPSHGVIDRTVSPERPDKFGLLFTRTYGFVQRQGNVYIHAQDGRVEWLA